MHTTPRRRSRARITLLAITVLGAVALGVNVAGAADEEPGDGLSSAHISVTQDLDEQTDEECVPVPDGPLSYAQVLTYQVEDTDAAFTLVVSVPTPLCDPIDDVSAVIYSITNAPNPWPQELSEKVDFTLQEKGTTTIRFEKDCDPVQYDVLTMRAPENISSPDEHGPLLFNGDVKTAKVFTGPFPEECQEDTSATEDTDNSSTTTTTTMPEPDVESVTTIAQPTDETGGIGPATVVGGSSASRPAGAALAISG